MFCMFLFNFVNYVFLFLCYVLLLLCLCILIVMYVPFWISCFIALFCELFMCKCVLYYCHRVSTQLQLNISYHIIFVTAVTSHWNQKYLFFAFMPENSCNIFLVINVFLPLFAMDLQNCDFTFCYSLLLATLVIGNTVKKR